MKTKNIITLTVAALFACTSLFAQSHHEFSISTGGGLSTLDFSPSVGKYESGFGGHLGFGYSYFFTEQLGIGTGAEFTLLNSKYSLKSFNNIVTGLVDAENNKFELHSAISKYEEKQNSIFLNIPVMFHFQTPTGDASKFSAAVGGKIGLPIKSTFETSKTNFINKGYFPDYGGDWLTTQQFMGFGNFDKSVKDDINLNLAFMISAETGMKWDLSEDMSLFTGVYVDYGLNDIVKNNDREQNFISYDPKDGANFSNLSILNSSYTPNKTDISFADKVIPMAFGLKLRLIFKSDN